MSGVVESGEKYQAYPEYKDSGIDWVGVIPIGWNSIPLKFVVETRKGVAFKSSDFADSGTRVVKASDIKNLTIRSANNFLADKFKVFHPKAILNEKDIVLSTVGSTPDVINSAVGQLGMVPSQLSNTLLNQNTVVFDPDEARFSREYLFYALQMTGYRDHLDLHAHGTANQASLSISDMLDFTVPLQPIAEQQKIANFLDHETAKIDTLIEKQQQLIKLLKEKRQAVVSHAVTKGLNPDTPMKDSGVEWLGEVPEHWKVKRLRYLGSCQNGINISADYFGSGFPFVSYSDAYKNEVLPEYGSGLVQSSVQDRISYSVMAGDVIFTRTSETVEEIGFSSTCLKTIEHATFAGFLIRFRPVEGGLDSGFSKYYFRNLLIRMFFVKEMNLVTRASLSQDLLKKLPVTLPPIDEQVQISEFLDRQSALFTKLTMNAETAIELLQERRTALISAAVTGKIDVRNWKAPVSESDNKEAIA